MRYISLVKESTKRKWQIRHLIIATHETITYLAESQMEQLKQDKKPKKKKKKKEKSRMYRSPNEINLSKRAHHAFSIHIPKSHTYRFD